ncbi:MAG: O-antigen ligase family protein, partial [Oscillospiraceae bacterium]|nr:O-antigen ligase family protein [Oscillospiraceae bacterium]
TALLMQVWMGTGSYAVWPVLGLSAYAAHVLIRVFSAWTGKLETVRVKTVVIALSAAAVLFAAYMTAALNVRTAFPLDKPDARLTRAVALRPGEYTLTARMDVWDGGAGAYITVDALNPRQAAARTPSVLYQGRVTAAEFAVPFTVPQDAIAVHITASPLGEAGGRVSITEMTVSGEGRTAPIPLQYNLIPEAIVSRLQGVWADPNVYQRFMYWQDGLRLFAQSPIIGLGGYSFEALSNSVSDYYYVSKHTHNHYIQALTENGVLGLAAVLLTFALAFLALWRSRRDNPLIPYLAAAAGMMAAHNWVEASMQNLLVNNVFFLLLGVISGLFVKNGQPARARRARGKRVSHEAAGGERAGGGAMAKAGVILVCTTCLVCVGLLGGRLLTAAGVRRAESQGTQKALEAYRWAVATDPLNASQYKAACLIRYVADPDSGARELAQRFVSDMEGNWNTPGDCFIVGRYHLRTGNMTGAARYFERYIALGRMDSQVWDEVLAQYARFLRDAEPAQAADIIDSAARLRRYLDEVNQAALIPVSPNESLMRRVFDLI